MNHYQVLKLPRTATAEEIRTSYKQLALLYHPDKATPEKKEDATTMFALVAEAYKTLIDPTLRAAFDRSLIVRPQLPPSKPPPPTSTALTPYRPSSPSHSSTPLFAPTPIRPASPSFFANSNNAVARPLTPPPTYRSSSPHFNAPYRSTSPSLQSNYSNQATFGSTPQSQSMMRRPSFDAIAKRYDDGPGGVVPFPSMPSTNPLEIFENQFGGGNGYGVGGGGGYQAAERNLMREAEEEELQNKLAMRPDLEAQVNAMLNFTGMGSSTTFPSASYPEVSFGGGGVGGGGRSHRPAREKDPWAYHPSMFGNDPWGQHFEGEVRPNVTLDGQRNRGRSMSTSSVQGEKHRNGDYRIRQQKHDVEELNDGTIRFSSSNVEVRYTSGKPRHTNSSHSKTLSQSHQYDKYDQRPQIRSSSGTRYPDEISQPRSHGGGGWQVPSYDYPPQIQNQIQYSNTNQGQAQISYGDMYEQSRLGKKSSSTDLRRLGWGGGGAVAIAVAGGAGGGGGGGAGAGALVKAETGLTRRNSISGGWRS